jgi:hypothetical protein
VVVVLVLLLVVVLVLLLIMVVFVCVGAIVPTISSMTLSTSCVHLFNNLTSSVGFGMLAHGNCNGSICRAYCRPPAR